jgi:integrase
MKDSLNDKKVDDWKPPTKGSIFVWDENKKAPSGFGVRVTAAGTRSFLIDYRNKHRECRRFTIGQRPSWTVERARTEARRLRVEIDNGADPAQAAKDERATVKELEVPEVSAEKTVKDVCDAYMKQHVLVFNGPDQRKNAKDMIDKIIVPRFGERKADALTTAEVADLKGSMSGHIYRANQVLTVLKAAFNKGIEWGMCTKNPAQPVKRYPENKRAKWLTEEQLAALDRAITEYGKDSGELIRLLLLSGSRRGEWMRAKKEQFDMQHGVWTKPSHSVKERKQECLRLNAATMAVLRRVIASTPKDEPYLFPGKPRKGVRKPREGVRRPWLQILKLAGLAEEYTVPGKKRGPLKRWRPMIRLHDLRHSYASWLAEHGVPLFKIGKLLGHQQSQTTERYAHIADRSLLDASDMFGDAITKMVH